MQREQWKERPRVMKKILVLGLIALTIIILYCDWTPCNNTTVYPLPLPEDPLQSIIFYIESFASSTVNVRRSCAVESAARHHLNSRVKVFVISSDPAEEMFSVIHSLSNIDLIKTSYQNIFRGTPLEQWYRTERWKNKPYLDNYINNIIRFLLVWKFGGIYLDADVIVLKPLRYFKDFVVKESDSSITAAVFGFQEKHPFSSLCLNYLENRYKTNNSSRISDNVVTRTLMDFCQISKFENIQEKHCKIYTLPSPALFPVPNKKWLDYFTSSKLPYVLNQMEESYMIHTYSSLSDNVRVPLGSGTVLEEAMRLNCPLVYHHVTRKSGYL